MRKYLLPQNGIFHKANLHAHSTGSDGIWTPEQMKSEFKKHGYDILCITEHEILCDYTYLSDEDFVFINGYEMSINEAEGEKWSQHKCVHLNLYSKTPDNKTVCYDPDSVWFMSKEDAVKVPHIGEFYKKKFSTDGINDVISIANDNGYICCLNHPGWSLLNFSDYKDYNGLFAVEVYNTDCVDYGWNDDFGAYESLVANGKRIFPHMADDNHNPADKGYGFGSFGGFDMIKTVNFTYDEIVNALARGDFYCSQSPLIYDLYVEDNVVHIKTSAAVKITMSTGIRAVRSIAGKTPIYEAEFEIKDIYKFIRFTVTDENGKRALTRAYYIDEWK